MVRTLQRRVNQCHLPWIAFYQIGILRKLRQCIHIFAHKDIRVHKQINISAAMLCQPVLHTSCKLCVSCTVQENTVQIHHPVLHIALACFCYDALDYILSTVRWILGNTAAAFLKNVGERCVYISFLCISIPDFFQH